LSYLGVKKMFTGFHVVPLTNHNLVRL